MKGQLMELLIYPYLVGVLLFSFQFFARNLLSEIRVSEQVLNQSLSAVDSSNMALLNCSLDHVVGDCSLPNGKGTYGVRRLALVHGEVKELIYPTVR